MSEGEPPAAPPEAAGTEPDTSQPPMEKPSAAPQAPPTTQPSEPAPAPAPQSQVNTNGGGNGSKAAAAPAPSMPPTPQEKKAREFFDQAEKKYRSSLSFFGGLFGGTSKKEEAADLFVRAANQYKVAKRFKAAGESFKRAAEIHMELDTKHESASNLCEAAQVLKREDPREAVICYLRAVEIYTDMGRFSLAARYHNNVAEIYEGELQDYKEAIANYERAADYYKGEDSTGSGNKCLLKVAHMCATMQDFSKGASVFEDVARSSLDNTLLKYAAKEYFFKAAICHFCMSPQAAQDAIVRYKELQPAFEGTREIKLITDLLGAVEEDDTDKFSDIVKEYDAISRIDAWLTAQLLHIKKNIDSDETIN